MPSHVPRFRILLLLVILLLAIAVPSYRSDEVEAAPALVFNRTGLRDAELPDGIAGMMAEYVPETGQVYLLGGYRTESGQRVVTDEIWTYDPVMDTLTMAGTLPEGIAKAAHAYSPDENLIYLFGGLVEDSGGSGLALTDAIYTYHVITGETQKLAATLPAPRARAVAAYTKHGIFVAGGGKGTTTFSTAYDEVLQFDAAQDSIVNTIALPDDYGGSFPNHWVAAHLLHEIYPTQFKPEPDSYSQPAANTQVLILGTHGYARLDPATATIVDSNETNNLHGNVGAATAYLPTRRHVYSTGGYSLTYNDLCADPGVDVLDPRRKTNTDMTQAPIPATGSAGGLLPDTLHDSAAVYVPDLDRMLVFGGFANTTENGTDPCDQIWPNAPESGQYTTQIYSISPEYYNEQDWTEPEHVNSDKVLLLYEAVNPVAGQTVNMNFYRANSSENFDVVLQAPFRSTDGEDYLMSRVVESEITGSNTISVTIPTDIKPSPSGRRVVAFCLVSSDRFLPPNCREVPVTLVPGSLAGTVTRDMSGAGLSGIEPVDNAVVELRDRDDTLVATTTTDTNGDYSFCSAGTHCLAVGTYTLNVSREYDLSEDYVHLPKSVAVEVVQNETADGDVEMETTEVVGPTVRRLTADHDRDYSDTVGTFLVFDHLSGVNPPEVLNTFTVKTQDFLPQRPTAKVEFRFEGTNYERTDTDGSDGWQATFDMTEVLEAGNNYLEITAYDNQDLAGEPRRFRVKAIRAKSIADSWDLGTDGITWNPHSDMYTTHLVTDPGNPPLGWPDNPPQTVDAGPFTFYNSFGAELELYERYRIDGMWSAQGDGDLVAQVMALSEDGGKARKDVHVFPSYNQRKVGDRVVSQTIDEYNVLASFNLCKELRLFLRNCDKWVPAKRSILYDKPIKNKKGKVITKRKLGIGIDMKYGADMYVTGVFDGDDWELDRVRVTPRPNFGVRGSLAFKVDAFIASVEVGASIAGEVYYSQPIIFEPRDVYLDNPCLQFIVKIKLWLEGHVFGIGGRTEWEEELLNEKLPSGCNPTQLQKLYELMDFETPDYAPAPTAGVAQDGSLMRLWVEDTDSSVDGIDLKLKYAYDDIDDTADDSGIVTDAVAIYDPQVAFFEDGSAIAVWSQIDRMAGADEDFTGLLLDQEMYASFWQEGSGWSAPERITNNSVSDGRPSLTTYTDGSANQYAAVAWVRDSDGDAATVDDWQVVTRRWQNGSWQTETPVGNAAGTTNWEPAIGYNHAGDLWLVWLRDDDADFLTLGDRRLTYATYTGGSWSSPTQPASWPARAKHPSITFSPLSDYPLIAMVVSPDGSGDAPEAAVTVQNKLYAAWRGPDAAGWDVQSVGNTRGAWPQATVYTENHAMIVLRGFGGGQADGEPSVGGQIAVAAGKLARDGARWAPPGVITDDDTAIWQVGAVTLPIPSDPSHPVPNGMMEFVAVDDALPETAAARRQAMTDIWRMGQPAPVRMTAGRQARMLGGTANTGVFEVGEPMDGIDPYVEDVQVSNPVPAQGEVVTVTATIRNDELRPMGSTDDTDLKMRLTCQQDVVCQAGTLDEQTHNGEMLFNEVLTYTLTYRSSGDVDRLRVVLEQNTMDLDRTNNEQLFVVGRDVVPAPSAVQASLTAADQVDVRWQAPADEKGGYQNTTGHPFTYRIYRSGSEDGPWTLIGLSRSPFYMDRTSAADPTQFYYAVRANDIRSRRSPISAGVQAVEYTESNGLQGVFLPMVLN